MKWKRTYAFLMVILLLLVACCRTLAAGTDQPEIAAVPPAAEQPPQPEPAPEPEPEPEPTPHAEEDDDPLARYQGEKIFAQEEAVLVGTQTPTVSLDLPCKAALLMCSDTGDVLYEYKAKEQLAMASITKVMTLLLTFEALDAGKISMEDIVPVSNHAFSMGGSQIWLEPGEQFTLHEMVKAIVVSSANDAAVAVAEFVGGSEPAFVDMMNQRAAQLGMKDTCFKNACGLDADGHYSSAADIATMSLELMKHEKVFEYTGIWTDTLRNGETQLTNTNKLLRSYQGITGLKTGTTGKAGVCISATATRDNTGLIAVVLGSASSKERFAAATALLDYGFANYENVPFPPVAGMPQQIGVSGGAADAVALTCQLPECLLLKKGQGSTLRCEVSVTEQLQAPVAAGQQVGEVRVFVGEAQLAGYPVVTATAVDAMSFSLAMDLLWQGVFAL